jgi:hypothetical protein
MTLLHHYALAAVREGNEGGGGGGGRESLLFCLYILEMNSGISEAQGGEVGWRL